MEFDLLKFFIAILAGVVTVFTPCTFPFLPVILGRSLGGSNWKKPLTILLSLAVSLFIFGIVFSVTLKLFGFKQSTLTLGTGILIAIFGYITLVPEVWDYLMKKLGFFTKSKAIMEGGVAKQSAWGDIVIGFAMGPVFTGCSPVLLAILPLIGESTRVTGGLYLLGYILGLVGLLGAIAIFGQKLTKKLQFTTNPHGNFKRHLGIILLIMGVLIISGGDKTFEAWLIENGFNFLGGIEGWLGNSFEG